MSLIHSEFKFEHDFSTSLLNGVPYVPTCLTCPMCPTCPHALRAQAPYEPYVPTCPIIFYRPEN